MLVLLIAFLLAGGIFGLVTVFFGTIPAIFPSILVLLATYFVLARKVSKQIEGLMLRAQSEMQKGRIDRGIVLLDDARKKYKNWQFFTESAINGQIGSIYYMRQAFKKARPYLENSFSRHWIAKGMLGVLYFKDKDFSGMDKVFEKATSYSPKQGLLWNVWAFCHWKAGHQEKAIDILLKGQGRLGDKDTKLSANLINLKNNKKMKMRGYGEQWYQFQLETSPQMRVMRTRQVRFSQR